MRKRKKSLEIEGKEACFSSIMKTVALITLYFISRDVNKDDMTKKTVGICSKTTGLGPKWVKIPEKKTLTSFSREHVFARLPHRSRDNSDSFGSNYFKISGIGPNCLFYILFYGISSTSNWSSFTVF